MNILRRGRLTGVLLIAALASCGPKDQPIPVEPQARSAFLYDAAAKLAPNDRALLDRFSSRLEAQVGAGVPAPQITVPRALELQRSYEAEVASNRSNFHKLLDAANADIAVEVGDAAVIRNQKSRPPADPTLRYVINVNNRGQRTVEQLALRVEIRDASGKYQAAIPNLELQGSLRPGQTGRSVQTLPLDARHHQYILEGKPLQITAYPTRVVYAGGDNLEPGKELQAMESLHRAKIE